MRLIAVLSCFALSVLASENIKNDSALNEVVYKLSSEQFLSPIDLLSNLRAVKRHVHELSSTGSESVIRQLVNVGLLERIVLDYSVELFEEVLGLFLFNDDDLLAVFQPEQAKMSSSNPLFKHYLLFCRKLALSLTNGSEFFSPEAVELQLSTDSKGQYYREILFGLIHLRGFEFSYLPVLVHCEDDPYVELVRRGYYEILLAVIKKFKIPPTSQLKTTRFGPEGLLLKDFLNVESELRSLL